MTKVKGTDQKSSLTLAMQNSRGFSFSRPYFSSASTTAKSAVSLVDSRMVLYGMLGFRLSAYIRSVPPARRHDANYWSTNHLDPTPEIEQSGDSLFGRKKNILTNI